MSLGRALWLPGGPGSCVPLDSPVWSLYRWARVGFQGRVSFAMASWSVYRSKATDLERADWVASEVQVRL